MAALAKNISLEIGARHTDVIGEEPNLNLLKIITSVQNVTFFEAEEKWSMETEQLWFQKNFINTFYVVGLYLVVIFGGRYLMKTREKFELRGLLVLWNTALAIFSILGTMRVVPELLHVLLNQRNGFYHSVCTTGFYDNKVVAYWNCLFVLSKWIELGDTVFIVLRKQPLIFLHWYHHLTVLIFTWYTANDCSATGRWYSSMNYTIHSFLYTYYALRALRFKIPKNLALALTSLQVIQMVIGVGVISSAYLYKNNGYRCEISDNNINFGLAIYASYWVLFANFLYEAYFGKTPKFSKDKTAEIKKQN